MKTPQQPETAQGGSETECERLIPLLKERVHHRPQSRDLLMPVQGLGARFSPTQIVLDMCQPHSCRLATRLQALQAKLADGLQEDEMGFFLSIHGLLDQALIEQRGHPVHDRCWV